MATTFDVPITQEKRRGAFATRGLAHRWRLPFSGVAELPDLNRELHEAGLNLLHHHGVQAVHLAGGRISVDGRIGFVGASSVALAVLRQIVQRAGGLRYRDSARISWAAWITDDVSGRPGYWEALAIGHARDVRLLDSTWHGRGQPGVSVGHRVPLNRQSLRGSHLAVLDRGLGLMQAIVDRAASTQSWSLSDLAVLAWPSPWDRPDDNHVQLLDGLALVGLLPIRKLRLRKTGWDPRICQSETVFRTLQHTSQQVTIEASPLLFALAESTHTTEDADA